MPTFAGFSRGSFSQGSFSSQIQQVIVSGFAVTTGLGSTTQTGTGVITPTGLSSTGAVEDAIESTAHNKKTVRSLKKVVRSLMPTPM